MISTLFGGMFSPVTKLIDFKSLIIIGLSVALLVSSYQAGKMAGKTDATNRENIRIINTTRDISEGINEFQRSNPDRDATISLERLRLRQTDD